MHSPNLSAKVSPRFHRCARPARVASIVVVGVLLAFGVSSCGGSDDDEVDAGAPPEVPGDPAPPDGTASADDLAGRTFRSVEVQGRTLVADTEIEIEFIAGDGDDALELRAVAGCNNLGGTVQIDDATLVAGAFSMTEMSCGVALDDQDSWLVEVLLARPTVRFDAANLVLETDDVAIAFTEVLEAPVGLEDVEWELDGTVSGSGDDATVGSVPAGVDTPRLRFADDTVTVFTGCNSGSGEAVVDADAASIEFGPVALTRRACLDPAGVQVEASIVAVLEGEVDYSIEGDQLVLDAGAQGLVLRAGEE